MPIAFDAATDGGVVSSTSLTFAHTCTGSDLVLLVGVVGDTPAGADDITGVTYAGAAMTLVAKVTHANVNRLTYLYIKAGPATGANNVVISATSSHNLEGLAASYTGCAQSGQPDASTTAAVNVTGSTPAETSLASVADNCWHVLVEQNWSGGSAPNAGTGTTRRVYGVTYGTSGMFDSNSAKTPAGSVTLATYRDAPDYYTAHIMATLAPAGVTSTFVPRIMVV